MWKGAVLSASEKKELLPVASLQNITNHFCLLLEKPISHHPTSDILSEKNKSENLTVAEVEKMKHENVTNWKKICQWGRTDVKNGTAADAVIIERRRPFASTLHKYCIKLFNMFLFRN
jgi:hypothetical protein